MGSHLGKARLKIAAWFLGHTTDIQNSGYPWRCLRTALTNLCQIFEACEGTTPPYLSSLLRSAGGKPPWRNASILPGDDEGSYSSFQMKYKTVFCLLFCNSWVFCNHTLHPGHVVFVSNGHRLGTTVTVFKRRFAELKFLVPLENCRSRWRMVSKAVWQTLEALLERLPLMISVIHHCTKISPWRRFCTVGQAVTHTNLPSTSLADRNRMFSLCLCSWLWRYCTLCWC